MTSDLTRGRMERRAAHAWAFDRIGARYDEAYAHKQGQLEAGDWLAERLAPGSRVLDIGCGTGLPTARRLTEAGHRVTGIDISEGMLRIAREEVPEGDFRLMDMTELDKLSGRFDAVVAFFALLLLPRADIPPVLKAIHDLLEPGGLCVLSMVEADLDDTPISFLGSPIRVTGYIRDDLRAVVAASGLEILDLRHFSYAPASTEAPPEVQLFVHCRRDGLR